MDLFGALVMPMMVCGIILYGLFKGVNVFDCFMDGSKSGIKTAMDILPAMLALVLSVSMLKSSGALSVIVATLRPISDALGIPAEVAPLALLCPISGSGALSMYETILGEYGVDNVIERTASIMMCSTDTTFYAVAIYYGAINIKKIRYTLPAALTADLTSFIMSAFFVRMMY